MDYRKPEDQYLDDWEKADYERLNLMETYREDEIEKRQKEKREDKEKLVRELAELSFLQGFPSISQLKKLNEISSQEQKAFFRVLDELKKNRLFLGENPTNEILNAVNACEIEEKRLFNKIVDFLNGEPKKTEKKPTDASNDPVGALLEKSIQEAGDELK